MSAHISTTLVQRHIAKGCISMCCLHSQESGKDLVTLSFNQEGSIQPLALHLPEYSGVLADCLQGYSLMSNLLLFMYTWYVLYRIHVIELNSASCLSWWPCVPSIVLHWLRYLPPSSPPQATESWVRQWWICPKASMSSSLMRYITLASYPGSFPRKSLGTRLYAHFVIITYIQCTVYVA